MRFIYGTQIAERVPLDQIRIDLDDLVGMVVSGIALGWAYYLRNNQKKLDVKETRDTNGLTARVRVLEALRIEDRHEIERLQQELREK